ncbi:acyltransferase family protein [Micromonospora thermarum]|uniref:Acyltransferase n=1 Tax=Micromonospora thermarum TaxID=2720024 RepID=A0ABX0Z8M5_9ACTN|nr:acyltransferase [Micromonospora thermarum]NJP33609.1 acyltransferase [Micromonospora thermarum]
MRGSLRDDQAAVTIVGGRVRGEEPVVTAVREDGTGRRARIFFPELEGLRGIAAVMVMLTHVALTTGVIASDMYGAPGNPVAGPVLNTMDVSVPIFFVLSGLVLYRPLARATLTDRPAMPVRPYFWRRALRILPAYWVLTVVALVVLNADAVDGPRDVLFPLLVLQVYDPATMPTGMEQTWSLATEVAFYVTLPLVAWALRRYARRATDPAARVRRIVLPLGGVVLVGAAFAAYHHLPSMGPFPVQHLWPTEYAGYLAAGMVLATLSAAAEVAPGRQPAVYRFLGRFPGVAWLGALAAYALASSPLSGPNEMNYPPLGAAMVDHVLYLVIAVLAVAPLALPTGRPRYMRAVLSNPVVAFLGRISYGVFLWHVFHLWLYFGLTGTPLGTGNFWLVMATVLGASVVTATASWYLVERPAMRLRPWLGRAPVDPGTDAPRTVPEQPAVTEALPGWATRATAPVTPAN